MVVGRGAATEKRRSGMSRGDLQVMLRLPGDLRTRVKSRAARNHRSMNAEIVLMIEAGLERKVRNELANDNSDEKKMLDRREFLYRYSYSGLPGRSQEPAILSVIVIPISVIDQSINVPVRQHPGGLAIGGEHLPSCSEGRRRGAMSTLKCFADQGARNFRDLLIGWHTDFAGPKGNAPTAATVEALDLR